jgi:hypothetical protein
MKSSFRRRVAVRKLEKGMGWDGMGWDGMGWGGGGIEGVKHMGKSIKLRSLRELNKSGANRQGRGRGDGDKGSR